MTSDFHARAKQVFFDALELPTGLRHSYVERVCGDDGALRAEVQSLLDHHDTETLIAAPGATAPLIGQTLTVQPLAAGGSLLARAVSAVTRPRPLRQLALGALVAILLLTLVGIWVHRGTEAKLRQILGEKLRGMLDADAAAVELWIESKKARVREWSADRTFGQAVNELLPVAAAKDPRQQLVEAPQHAAIQARLGELAQSNPDFVLWDRTQTVIADSSREGVHLGRTATPTAGRLLSHVFNGETILCLERPTEGLMRGAAPLSDSPHLTLITPVTGDDERVLAALMVRDIDRAGELDKLLGHVYTGETGECYAFDREGVMLTESRFNDELVRIGLIPANAKTRSATVVALRDPGGDMTKGYRPVRALAACPLTSMAAHAVAGENGIDMQGYRDYRGVRVIGAWKWLSDYQFGIAIEIDRWEAFAPLKYLDVAFGGILALLGVALAAVVASSFSIVRLRREVRAARQLGQYTLEELIGEGGMGQVYRARHSLLKRPTAVKVLKPQCSNPQMLARFEREVQLSSQLRHPNTIEIYDYGCTPDGVFYYAMEYVDGLNLTQVVTLAGPLPPARVVFILRQVCGSLREAHSLNLLHRDIKPQNIMLCCRGGESDVVKVLDFGLVKQMASTEAVELTSSSVVAGTPLYMSPERLFDGHAVDARSDIYSLGAVGFKLLTGKDIFAGKNISELLAKTVHAPAPRPSEHTDLAIPRELDDLIAACLAKDVQDRPASAAELLDALSAIRFGEPWTERQAAEWWQALEHSAAYVEARAAIEPDLMTT
ncbi:MAG TPA: protein kinase [Pirellulales bacterium]|nr:protein kinase [Pirellulales bacterium]